MKFLIAAPLLLGFLTACTGQENLTRGEWSPYSSATADLEKVSQNLKPYQFSTSQRVYLGTETSTLKNQTIYNIPVLNTWIKENKSNQGLHFLSYQIYAYEDLPELPSSFFKNTESYAMSLESIRKLTPQGDKLLDHAPAFMAYKGSLAPVWVINYLKDGIHLRQKIVHAKGFHVLSDEPMGSSFQKSLMRLQATVYPEGPKRSGLEQVQLSNLQSGPFISSRKLRIHSASGKDVPIQNEPLNFDPEDEKFPQVQVYYTLQKANSWFEQNLGWTWAGILEVQTQMGYPENINSAFYYRNRIRLGQGDGVRFKNIPLDPSIVIHESVHAVVDRLTGLPFQGEGGSINEALADFITACQLNTPLMGEVAIPHEENRRSLTPLRKWSDLNGGLYNDSLVISYFLWSLRETLGEEKVLQSLVRTLRDTTPGDNFKSFSEKFIHTTLMELNSEERALFFKTLKQAHWPTDL